MHIFITLIITLTTLTSVNAQTGGQWVELSDTVTVYGYQDQDVVGFFQLVELNEVVVILKDGINGDIVISREDGTTKAIHYAGENSVILFGSDGMYRSGAVSSGIQGRKICFDPSEAVEDFMYLVNNRKF